MEFNLFRFVFKIFKLNRDVSAYTRGRDVSLLRSHDELGCLEVAPREKGMGYKKHEP